MFLRTFCCLTANTVLWDCLVSMVDVNTWSSGNGLRRVDDVNSFYAEKCWNSKSLNWMCTIKISKWLRINNIVTKTVQHHNPIISKTWNQWIKYLSREQKRDNASCGNSPLFAQGFPSMKRPAGWARGYHRQHRRKILNENRTCSPTMK